MPAVRALIFDVFGTLVDWHGSIARELRQILGPRVSDPAAFAEAWRAQYQPAMQAVRSGALPFCKLDLLHRHNLDRVLADLKLDDVDEATRQQLNLAWHRLDAWPDVAPALHRLRSVDVPGSVSRPHTCEASAIVRGHFRVGADDAPVHGYPRPVTA